MGFTATCWSCKGCILNCPVADGFQVPVAELSQGHFRPSGWLVRASLSFKLAGRRLTPEETSMKTATGMNDLSGTAPEQDICLDDLAAQLTIAIYPLALVHGLKGSWIELELGLWRALTNTVDKWCRKRPSAPSSDAFEDWRKGLLVDLTESAFFVAIKNGIEGAPLEVELDLYRVFRLMIGRRRRIC
jgi:hypothetical protein